MEKGPIVTSSVAATGLTRSSTSTVERVPGEGSVDEILERIIRALG